MKTDEREVFEEEVKVNERKEEMVDVGDEVTGRPEVKRVEEKVEPDELKKVATMGVGGRYFEV